MKRLITVLFISIGFLHMISGQNDPELDRKLALTNDLPEKLSLINHFADSLIWAEGDLSLARSYLEKAEALCRDKECGDQLIWSKGLLAEIAMDGNDFGPMEALAPQVLKEGQVSDPHIKAYLFELHGLYDLYTGNWDAAGDHLWEAKRLLEGIEVPSKRLARVFEYLGHFHNFSSSSDSSVFYGHKAAEIYQTFRDTNALVHTLVALGVFYGSDGDYKRSIEQILKAKDLADEITYNEEAYYSIRARLSTAYENQEAFDKAEAISMECIAALEAAEEMEPFDRAYRLWDFYIKMARIHSRRHEPEESLRYAEKSLQLTEEFDFYPINKMASTFYKIEANVRLGNYEYGHRLLQDFVLKVEESRSFDMFNVRAIRLLTDVYLNSELRPSPEFQEIINNIIARIREKNQDQKNSDLLAVTKMATVIDILQKQESGALAGLQKILDIEKTIWDEKRTAAVNELLVQYEAEEQKNQIQYQELELKSKTSQRNLLLGFIAVLVIGFLFLLLYLIQRRNYARILEKEVASRTKKLKETNDQLLQSNEELERFAYIASHDLKEPLRNILSFVGIIRSKGLPKGDDLQTQFKFIEDNGKQMYRLVEDVLEFSKLRQVGYETEVVDVVKVMEEVKLSLSQIIEQKKAVIEVSKLPQIKVDHSALFQVLKNLVENAVKYNESSPPVVEVSYLEDETHHYFQINDNGIGVEPQYQSQIFEMFKRLHNKEQYEGTGIGLAICNRIVQFYDGEITIEQRDSGGSIFRFGIKKL